MQKFEIEIRNEKINRYKTITLLIVILSSLIFIFLLFDIGHRISATLSLCFIFFYTVYRFFIAKKKQLSFFFDEWIFFGLMMFWVNDYLLAAIIYLLLFLLYTISLQKIIYNFESSFIKQKNFPWKKYQWNELNNVLLKDDLLTIDFKNNRVIQMEIMSRDINDEEFNAFVRSQLEKYAGFK